MFIVELLLLVFEKMLVAFFCIESFKSVVENKDNKSEIRVKIKGRNKIEEVIIKREKRIKNDKNKKKE